MDCGAGVDWIAAKGDTALSVAAVQNHTAVVELLDRSATVDHQNEEHSTVLHSCGFL